METQIIPADESGIRIAAELIKQGQVVGMPTETVYGLAADATNTDAVNRIFAAKGRPSDNPLIVHIADSEMLDQVTTCVSEVAAKLMNRFWPGPMTLIMPKSHRIPDIVSANLHTVGIRMPSKEAARALIRASSCPIAAPSANLSGKPSPTTAAHVYKDMKGRIPLILDGGDAHVGLESTVIDTTESIPIVLRPGAITPEMIRDTIGDVIIDSHVLQQLSGNEIVRSPGMKYKHYAPKADITIFKGSFDNTYHAIISAYDNAVFVGECPAILGFSDIEYGNRRVYGIGRLNHPEEEAKLLFEALRDADSESITSIFCSAIDSNGMGLAVMNRLIRAAGFHIVDV